ncbi:retron-type reverse transcriptase [Nitrosomonas nitrosa]|uniref:reverse transcriptase domain-containing protein n=1 Tax=Nitrosomonas nitrosa TaxID=52442 RepID=UPI000D4F5840|nr:reverse transcriptase domain-containing protein [Nitrosomonas nitrosa]PTR04501.1 retron-type reverse transcriptase [Nitrosomonas nitrosa]
MGGINAQKYFKTEELKTAIGSVSEKNADVSGNSPLDYVLNSDDKLASISQKCLNGKYKFPPYNLKLFLKGPGKPPREISVPSLLDQALLKSIDQALKNTCPIENQTALAFFIIQDLKDYMQNLPEAAQVMRLDIKQFFDRIQHETLLQKLNEKKCPDWLMKLVSTAITTPAKEKGIKTPRKKEIGVPQGISIASYLADLYLENFDKELQNHCLKSARYVDDILIIYSPKQETGLLSFLKEHLASLGLEFHEEGNEHKFFKGSIYAENGVDFLGYHFFVKQDGLLVSVRNSSAQKFVNSLVGLVTKYKKGGYGLNYPDTCLAEDVFRYDLNERITGAFKGDQRYGWLWYFRQMNDLPLLDRIDKIVKRELAKSSDTKHIKTKRLKRAYYEIQNFSPGNTYILNYGLTDAEKIQKYFGFLDARISRSQTDEKNFGGF